MIIRLHKLLGNRQIFLTRTKPPFSFLERNLKLRFPKLGVLVATKNIYRTQIFIFLELPLQNCGRDTNTMGQWDNY